MKKMCVYCGSEKNVKVWDKTGEILCFACRFEFLAQEFDLDDNSKIEVEVCRDILKP